MSTKINFYHNRLREQNDYISGTREIHEIVNWYQANTPNWPKRLEIFPYSLFYVFFEQYFTIKGITVQNYVVSLLLLLSMVSV